MRGVCGTWCEVDEERLVRCESLLELHPGDRVVSHVGHKVVAWVVRCLDPVQPFVKTGRPLVGFAADEAVELVEARTRRPAVGRTGGADFPRRRLVVLAEEGGAKTI